MSLRIWALKRGELRPLSRGGLLLLTARCAMRVEPWVPQGANKIWKQGLQHVVAAAYEEPSSSATILARALSNRGADACNRLASTDEPLGRCLNYATQTLAASIEATSLDAGPALKKVVIEAAKLAASIAGVLGHAGRVRALAGKDPVDVACVAIWSAIRADIPVLAVAASDIAIAKDRVRALRNVAPLWIGRVPGWVLRH